jgi:hypothetical protein
MSSLLTLHVCGVHDSVAAQYLKHIDEPHIRPSKCMVNFERNLIDPCGEWREVRMSVGWPDLVVSTPDARCKHPQVYTDTSVCAACGEVVAMPWYERERVLYEWVGVRGPENPNFDWSLDSILRHAVEVGTLRQVRLRKEWVCRDGWSPDACQRNRVHHGGCGEVLVEVPR